MGLLSRANTLDELKNNPGLAFSDFINKHSLKICALLEKKANNYIVTNSIGFDAESIISATSANFFVFSFEITFSVFITSFEYLKAVNIL